MDASNMLKPMLARGELHTIGATTLDEYRKHIEKDAALERRFQPVLVGEPTVEDTISILRGLRERYEIHHGVKFKDSALVAAARAVEPLHHRPLPARQGDRPDRRGRVAAAHGDRLDAGGARRGRSAAIMQLEIEREALRKETDRRRRSGCRSSRRSWPTSRKSRRGWRRTGSRRRTRSSGARQLKEELEQRPRSRSSRRSSAGDYAKASELQYGRLPELERQHPRAGDSASPSCRRRSAC